jgi:hypothetical protein
MAELSLENRNLKLVMFASIGVFSLFFFFIIVLFAKYLVKRSKSLDTEILLKTLSGVVMGMVLFFLILFAIMKT